MNIVIIEKVLLLVAVLNTGVTYGTDVFFAVVVKKAVRKSSDSAIADLIAHIHLVADKRLPVIGMTSMLSVLLFTCLHGLHGRAGWLALVAVIAVIGHLVIYLRISKPINAVMSAAVLAKTTLPDIRRLQQKWDSVIVPRAVLLTMAMGCLLAAMSLL